MNYLKKTTFFILCVTILSISQTTAAIKYNTPEFLEESLDEDAAIVNLYESFAVKNASIPQLTSFSFAVKGYYKLLAQGKIKNKTLTIIDFSLSSTQKRMWVLDMTTQKVLFNTVVAHGKNTGGEFATNFSNSTNSFKSSLGFYIPNETYYGKNGLSLFLDGQERGINDNARKRYVVMHGAKYANPNFIKKYGRLGRSLGCPALPTAISAKVINLLKGKSCLFIYHPNKNYKNKSKLIA